MIDRKHIEKFLELNGLSPDAPDEEIKSLLLSARWHNDDVETALVVLREHPKTKRQHIDSMYNITSSDKKISPDTLNALLGIDVNVHSVTEEHHRSLDRAYRAQLFTLAGFSVLAAAAFVLFVMWYTRVGIFAASV